MKKRDMQRGINNHTKVVAGIKTFEMFICISMSCIPFSTDTGSSSSIFGTSSTAFFTSIVAFETMVSRPRDATFGSHLLSLCILGKSTPKCP